mgnify:CR=1 FL=1
MLAKHLAAAVVRGRIHDDDLVILDGQGLEHCHHVRYCLFDVLFLVVEGNDDRQHRRIGHRRSDLAVEFADRVQGGVRRMLLIACAASVFLRYSRQVS